MPRLIVVATASMVALLAACSRPASIPHDPSAQYKIGYLQHWQTLADRTAAALVADVANHPEINPGFMLHAGASGSGAPARPANVWFINSSAPQSAFGKEFTKLLEASLLERGQQVSLVPRDAIIVNLDASTFLYPTQDATPLKIGPGTLLGTLAAVGIVNADASWGDGDWAATAVGVGVLADIVNALSDDARGEVMLTTSITHRDRLIQRHVEPFYAEPSRLPLYWQDGAPARPALQTDAARPEGPDHVPVTIRIQ